MPLVGVWTCTCGVNNNSFCFVEFARFMEVAQSKYERHQTMQRFQETLWQFNIAIENCHLVIVMVKVL